MNKKPWWQSKTLWLNAVGLGITIAQELSGAHVITPAQTVVCLAVGNAALRFITNKAIGLRS